MTEKTKQTQQTNQTKDLKIENIAEFFKNTYHLKSNPFPIHPCQTMKEYLDRFNEVDKFINDLNMLSISGIGANRVIIGDKGMGKTSLMKIYESKAKERGLKTIYVECVPNRAKDLMDTLLQKTMDRIIEDCTDVLRQADMKRSHGHINRSIKTTSELFSMWTNAMDQIKTKPVIVLFDETSALPEMHYVESYFNNYVFDHLKDAVFIMGCTTATYHKIDARMGGFIDRFPQVVNLPKFSEEDSTKCLKKKMIIERTKYDKKTKDELCPFTPKAVEHIIELSNGVPRYLLEIAFNTLVVGASEKAKEINVDVVDRAAFATKKSMLHNIWNSLSTPEKKVLTKIAEIGGETKLGILSQSLERAKSTISPWILHLVECGLVEQIGTSRRDMSYKLTVNVDDVKKLS